MASTLLAPEPVLRAGGNRNDFLELVFVDAIDNPLEPFTPSHTRSHANSRYNRRDEALPAYEDIPLFTSERPAPRVSVFTPEPFSTEQVQGVIYPSASAQSSQNLPVPLYTVPTLSNTSISDGASSSSRPLDRTVATTVSGKVIAFLIPFPKPRDTCLVSTSVPERFLMYIAPHARLARFQDDKQERRARKAYRAQFKDAVKAGSRARSTDMAFLERLPGVKKCEATLINDNDLFETSTSATATSCFQELVLAYPFSANRHEKEVRAIFMDSVLEWGNHYSGRNADMSKKLAKRLTHSCICGHHEHEKLALVARPVVELDSMSRYLAKKCWELDQRMFGHPGIMTPSERGILDSIGWEPEHCGTGINPEGDWQFSDMEEDIRNIMKKGAKEWFSACKQMVKESKKTKF